MTLKFQPLAYRMRPENLDEFVGQEHIVGIGKPLRIAIENNNLSSSLIFILYINLSLSKFIL